MGVFVGLFFVDVEFDDGVSSNPCRSGAHLRKVDSWRSVYRNTGRGFGKGEAEACLLEVWGCFIFLQPKRAV